MKKPFIAALAAVVILSGSWALLPSEAKDKQVNVFMAAATDIYTALQVAGDAAPRLNIRPDKFEFGNGTDAVDTNLYRSAANTLKTDDAFSAAGLTSTAASVLTSATFSGDLSGDGGDQFFGFLQDQVATTTTSLTAAQCGKTFVAAAAAIPVLPEASTVLGCRYTFVSATDDDVDIDPADGTDELGRASVDGAAIDGAAGDEYRMTDIGTSLTLEAVGANLWAVISHNGPITDVN